MANESIRSGVEFFIDERRKKFLDNLAVVGGTLV
jgi:hypothetical protein